MLGLDPSEIEAAKLLLPVIRDVAAWIDGETDVKPPVLMQLPDELQSRAALMRAEARARSSG